jgi:kynurenine formamidase
MDELVFDQVGVVQLDVGKGEALRLQHFEAACSRLKNTECLLIKTGFQRARATADYAHGPYITRELARWLRDQLPALKCIGLDTLSITSMESFDEGQEVHRILLGGKEAPFVIEDMDFSQINSRTEIDRLFVAPWFIERVDGGPCTAFAEVQK